MATENEINFKINASHLFVIVGGVFAGFILGILLYELEFLLSVILIAGILGGFIGNWIYSKSAISKKEKTTTETLRLKAGDNNPPSNKTQHDIVRENNHSTQSVKTDIIKYREPVRNEKKHSSQQPDTTVKGGVPQPSPQQSQQSQTYYISRIENDNSLKAKKTTLRQDALYELKTTGNNATLSPLQERSVYLIMQQKRMLEPIFTVSGTGNSGLTVTVPAKYKRQDDNVWNMDKKGEVELK